MLLQSLFFTAFAFVLTLLFAMSSLATVHSLAVSQTNKALVSEADRMVARIRQAAERDMAHAGSDATMPLYIVADTHDIASGISSHTAIEGPISVGTATNPEATPVPCPIRDAAHQCNISVGTALAEQRIWQSIDLRSTPSHGEELRLRRHVLLRLLRVRPYADVIAIRDDGVSGARALGDTAGAPALASDAMKPDATIASKFHDTRVHIYQPCRYLDTSYKEVASNNRRWSSWQGGGDPAGRQMSCDDDPGETTLYTHVTRLDTQANGSSWGH